MQNQKTRHPLPVKGSDLIIGTHVQLDQDSEFNLTQIPTQRQHGRSMCSGIALDMRLNVQTRNADPLLRDAYLHALMDWSGEGPEGINLTNRLGWHDPLRQLLQYGKMKQPFQPDIPAGPNNGGGAVTTAVRIIKYLSFDHPLWGIFADAGHWPAKLMKMMKLVLHLNSVKTIYGVQATITSGFIRPWFYLYDLAASEPVTLPVQLYESYTANNTDDIPTIPRGQYGMVAVVRSPMNGTSPEQLSSITRISFGNSNLLAQQGRYIESLNEELTADPLFIQDPVRVTNAAAADQKWWFRRFDPAQNFDGKQALISLVRPKYGERTTNFFNWDSAPGLNINNDNRAGTPADIDFIHDSIKPWTSAQLAWALKELGASQVALHPLYADTKDPSTAMRIVMAA